MSKSIFEKIVDRDIEATILLENDDVFAIEDNQPQAPVHCLVITREKFKNFEEMKPEIFNSVQQAILEVAKLKNIENSGYRVVTNIGHDGGQSVPHLHFHVLGGHRLSPKIG